MQTRFRVIHVPTIEAAELEAAVNRALAETPGEVLSVQVLVVNYACTVCVAYRGPAAA